MKKTFCSFLPSSYTQLSGSPQAALPQAEGTNLEVLSAAQVPTSLHALLNNPKIMTLGSKGLFLRLGNLNQGLATLGAGLSVTKEGEGQY